jgi:competence protein ComEA
MFAFTRQERSVLTLFVLIVLAGAVLNYAFVKYPSLKDMVNLIDGEGIYFKIDLNTAITEELMELPYIGRSTAENILQYRQQHGPFKSVEEVKNVKGIRDKNYERFYKYLKI